jgi:hypothetical protein
MVIENVGVVAMDEIELTETELFIKRLFVQGDYKQFADKHQIQRDDINRILSEVSLFLCKNKIPCSLALILKPIEESQDVFVSHTGSGASYIINSQYVKTINEPDNPEKVTTQPGVLSKPKLFTGKIKKDDTLVLCSENLAELDINFFQRIVLSSHGPEEICKKILRAISETGKLYNISVAAYNGSGTKRKTNKIRISIKMILLITIPLFLIIFGLIIFNLSSVTEIKPDETSPISTMESLNIPTEFNKDTIIQPPSPPPQIDEEKNLVTKPMDIVKKIKKLNFIVNGSVVMVSNWESVKQDILYINWDNGITDKKRVHKYPDYSSIPSSVKVTYKDNTTKSYTLK